jgi:histidinol-phosphate aminotransferase
MNLEKLLRNNILKLQPYTSARDDFNGEASVYLDANENPFNAPFNRYPDPLQTEVKNLISRIKNVSAENIFIGNGSDEAIDLLYRAFCEPRIDNVVAIEPTYGMYKVCAAINDIEYRKVLLDENFQFNANNLLSASNIYTKIIWLCSPNNPTGNNLNPEEIIKVLDSFEGIVVIDEAYIDFSAKEGFSGKLAQFPNLVILQTLSKAWGNAAIRLGMAFASTEIISILNKIKYPYNINILTQKQALKALQNAEQVQKWVKTLLSERDDLVKGLKKLSFVKHIYPTDANFVLVKTTDVNLIYQYLVDKGIIVRNRSNISLCFGCLRITVGTPEENKTLLNKLDKFSV